MLEDYAREASDLERQLVDPLRSCMTATLLKQPLPSEELAILQQARADGVNAPLLLICLFRCSDDEAEKQNLVVAAEAAKQGRQVCPETAALISSNLVLYKSKLSRPDFAKATESFINDTIAVWAKLSAPDTAFAAHDFYINYTFNGINRINANGKVDLLLAMAKQQEPPIVPWMMHLAASLLLKDGASHYRGSDFISNVAPENLQKFGELADLQTQHVLKAWTMAPGHGLLPAMLLDVEMRASSTPRSVDAWFRHALAARFEYNFNFPVYEESTRARWGGSPEKQLWLASKYVETGDLDSGIPVRMIQPLWSISQDAGRSRQLGTNLKIRRIVSDFVSLLKAYSLDAPHASVNSAVATMVAIVLWEAGDYESLDWLFRVYAGSIDCNQYHESRLHAGEMKVLAREMLTDPSLRWMTIRRTLFGDTRRVTLSDLDQTDLAIGEARSMDDGSDKDRTKLIAQCERYAAMLRKLLNHETVILSDGDLESWLVVDDSTKVRFPRFLSQDDPDTQAHPVENIDESVGVVDLRIWVPGRKGLLMCPFQIDPPVSLSMDVEELQVGDDPYGISLLIGPGLNVAELTGYKGPILTLNSAHQQVIRDQLPVVDWQKNMTVHRYGQRQSKYTIKIEAFPDGYRTYFGDKQLETVRTQLKTGGLLQLGRYISFYYHNMPHEHAVYRVSNVQLKKLKAASVDAVDEPQGI